MFLSGADHKSRWTALGKITTRSQKGQKQLRGISPLNPIRFYVMNTDVPSILISHAASFWLGLVRVLCDNKAPRIKRQVASIDKKSNFTVKSGPFRTSTGNAASSSQKKQTTSKTVTSGKVGSPSPSPRMHNFKDTKKQGKKTHIRTRPGGKSDVSTEKQHSQEEPSATTGEEPKMLKTESTYSAKDGPFRSIQVVPPKTVLKGNILARRHQVGTTTSHQMIPRCTRSTTKVTSSVKKTPTSSSSQTTRANCQGAGKHLSTMNQVQYHARPWRI